MAAGSRRGSPLVATMTGSITTGTRDAKFLSMPRIAFATAEMISAEQSRPVLLANNSRADRLNPRNFAGNFRDDARYGGQSIYAESRKRFQIGLNTSAGAAVRPGDSERDGWRVR